MSTDPDICVLTHPGFAVLAAGHFRRASGDAVPAMVVPMGEKEAILPLTALQRVFGIVDDSPDGHVLARIAESLDFVTVLHPGDAFPPEVLTGHASWHPEPRFRAVAEAQVRAQLAGRLEAAMLYSEGAGDGDARQELQRVFDAAAQALGLASRDAALELIGQIVDELAYIEALRHCLLEAVRRVSARLAALPDLWRGDDRRSETLTQVRRLLRIAVAGLERQFADLDARHADILEALRNADVHCGFIRSGRDALYRSLRAWKPSLAAWEDHGRETDLDPWHKVDRLYRFLAPRYMPVMEWTQINAARGQRRHQIPANAMAWHPRAPTGREPVHV